MFGRVVKRDQVEAYIVLGVHFGSTGCFRRPQSGFQSHVRNGCPKSSNRCLDFTLGIHVGPGVFRRQKYVAESDQGRSLTCILNSLRPGHSVEAKRRCADFSSQQHVNLGFAKFASKKKTVQASHRGTIKMQRPPPKKCRTQGRAAWVLG